MQTENLSFSEKEKWKLEEATNRNKMGNPVLVQIQSWSESLHI